MSEYFPAELREALAQAHKHHARKRQRLRIHAGDDIYRVLRLWDQGFALDAEDAPHLRGHVDLYDGARHLYQCLVVASDVIGAERIFEFKWATAAIDAPPVDFVRDEGAPIALLGH
ncbi:MAG: hypothetical protein WDA25_05825 [Paracoccaceae bacterium]